MSEKAKKLEEMTQKYGDPWIWGIYFSLILLSVLETYSASSREVASAGIYMPIIKHCIMLIGGGALVFWLYRINYNNKTLLALLIPVLAVLTLGSMAYVMMFGEVINGAKRAISLPGGVTLQPAELAKLSIVTLLAYILAKTQVKRDVSKNGMIVAALVVTVYGGLLLKNGLTNTLLLMAISISMLLIGGAHLKKICILALFYVVVFLGYSALKSHNDSKDAVLADSQKVEVVTDTKDTTAQDENNDRRGTWLSRVKKWWNSDSLVYKPIKGNEQEMFSRMAQAHGGVTGVGIGGSRETSRLPLAFSDYIFSIIVEDLGFVGGCIVLILYLWLLARAAMIARKCQRVLPALLVIGLASMIVFQALFHMAINTGVFPVSGQPLPLISKGGTSILVTSIAFGVMLSISRTIANYSKSNIKTEEEQLPDDLRAANPTQLVRSNEWK